MSPRWAAGGGWAGRAAGGVYLFRARTLSTAAPGEYSRHLTKSQYVGRYSARPVLILNRNDLAAKRNKIGPRCRKIGSFTDGQAGQNFASL